MLLKDTILSPSASLKQATFIHGDNVISLQDYFGWFDYLHPSQRSRWDVQFT